MPTSSLDIRTYHSDAIIDQNELIRLLLLLLLKRRWWRMRGRRGGGREGEGEGGGVEIRKAAEDAKMHPVSSLLTGV